MNDAVTLIVGFAIGYLCGSIPFGLIFTHFAGTENLRDIGSGNIGATNVLRTGRKGLAAATLTCDLLKGTVGVLIANVFLGHDAALLAGLGAFLGHVFPVWLRFNGGKGVATYIGILLAVAWPLAFLFGIVWGVVAWLFRYSSLAALVASLPGPVLLWFTGDTKATLLFVLLTVLLWLTHRANITRLLNGTESKIGTTASASE